jgi:hypothetical protein
MKGFVTGLIVIPAWPDVWRTVSRGLSGVVRDEHASRERHERCKSNRIVHVRHQVRTAAFV